MQRITKRILETRLEGLNQRLGMPAEPYKFNEATGRYDAQPGCYYVGEAYGGFRLEQMCEGGGSRDISLRGTRREVFVFIGAMLTGMRALGAVQEVEENQ